MKKSPDYSSVFASDFREYLECIRASGKIYRREEYILKSFDRFIADKGEVRITEEMVNEFIYTKTDVPPAQYSLRHRTVRGFSEYLRFQGKGDYIRPLLKSISPERCIPHIYTQDEISLLLSEAKRLNPTNSLRPQTYYTLMGLLVSTGLRISEAINLEPQDVNLNTGILHIKNTKFYKSRLVPVHPTTLEALKSYNALKDKHFPKNKQAFFLNNLGLPLNYVTVSDTFLQIVRKTGIRNPQGKGPRIHDFRHTFAVSRILAWYEEGVDVNLMLAQLATYMGHKKFAHTIYYLEAGTKILEKVSESFVLGGEPSE